MVYAIALGGSVRQGGVSKPVDASRSSGTLTINFAAKTGTLSVALVATDGSGLGTVTGNFALAATGPGYTGTISFGGASGVISGALFGPSALETGFGVALANGSDTYVGLGGGKKQ